MFCLKELRDYFSQCVEGLLDTAAEAESKEKHGVWDPMPEWTITSPLCPPQCRLQHIYYGQPYARVDLCQSRLYPLVRDFEFGL